MSSLDSLYLTIISSSLYASRGLILSLNILFLRIFARFWFGSTHVGRLPWWLRYYTLYISTTEYGTSDKYNKHLHFTNDDNNWQSNPEISPPFWLGLFRPLIYDDTSHHCFVHTLWWYEGGSLPTAGKCSVHPSPGLWSAMHYLYVSSHICDLCMYVQKFSKKIIIIELELETTCQSISNSQHLVCCITDKHKIIRCRVHTFIILDTIIEFTVHYTIISWTTRGLLLTFSHWQCTLILISEVHRGKAYQDCNYEVIDEVCDYCV